MLLIIVHVFSLYLHVSEGPWKLYQGQEFSTSTRVLLKMLENSQINLPAKLCNRILIYSLSPINRFLFSFLFWRRQKDLPWVQEEFHQCAEFAYGRNFSPHWLKFMVYEVMESTKNSHWKSHLKMYSLPFPL